MKGIIFWLNQHLFIILAAALSLGLVIGGWTWAFLVLGDESQPLILHFNSLVRINLTGSLNDVLGFVVWSILALLINIALSFRMHRFNSVFGRIIASASILWAVLIFVGIAAIIRVN